jgi:hypothetical protein
MAIFPSLTRADDVISDVPIRKVALTDILDVERTRDMLRRESYYRCTQHKTKEYDFDGHILRFGEENVDVPADGYIPMKRRRPSVRMDLPKVIVDRFTALVFGHEHFPTIRAVGDTEAEDYVKTLAEESKLGVRFVEARNMGGATGTAVLSWGFIGGKPLVEVHKSAFVDVVEWRDYDRRKPLRVVKAYPYKKRVWSGDGKPKEKTFYYARYWDDNLDITWREIPKEIAETKAWWRVPASVVEHKTGYCPVYWIQNLPDSSSVDGISDFENQEDDCDAIDIQLSATHKGTVANVDPTLVIRDSPNNNEGVIHKGSSHAIYSVQGAEYLELKGSAIKASVDLLDRLRQYELDKAAAVLLDPDTLTGSGISAAAMRTRYAPMLAKADILREQYGDALVDILDDMLSVSRKLREVKTDADGRRYWSRVNLPPRITEEKNEETGELVVTVEERTPGSGGMISLQWPPYFQATWLDRKDAVGAVKEAAGNQPVMSQKTAVSTLSPLFGTDPDDELEEIENDADSMDRRAQGLLERGAPVMDLQGENPDRSNDDDGNDDGDNDGKGDFDDM